MKFKIAAYAFIIFIIALLQSTILNNIKIYNVKPNLLLVLIVIVAFLTSNVEGAIVGFFCGLVHDMVSGKLLGFYALLGMYLGFCIGSLNKRLNKENIFIVLFFTFVSSIIYEYTVYLLNSLASGTIDFVFPLRRLILPEAIYNSFASIFIFIIVFKIHSWLDNKEKISRRY
jgi:rod shape-determining protein MreD